MNSFKFKKGDIVVLKEAENTPDYIRKCYGIKFIVIDNNLLNTKTPHLNNKLLTVYSKNLNIMGQFTDKHGYRKINEVFFEIDKEYLRNKKIDELL